MAQKPCPRINGKNKNVEKQNSAGMMREHKLVYTQKIQGPF
jgi:hypothetical protein